MPGTHSVYVAIAGEVVNRRFVLLRNFVLNGQEVLLIRYCSYTQTVDPHSAKARNGDQQ